MPVGVTLAELRRELRAEVGHSLNIAQGVNFQDTLDAALRRAQTELWAGYQWPSLELKMTADIPAGIRFWDIPPPLLFNPILSVWFGGATHDSGTPQYTELVYGISVPDLNVHDSIAGQVGWPLEKWQHAPKVDPTTGATIGSEGGIEWWPTPQQEARVLFVAQAALPPLILDTDRCGLDSYAITMFAGAQILARQKSEDAANLLGRAQEYLRRIRGQQGAKKRRIRVLGAAGAGYGPAPMRPYLDYIPQQG